ADEVRQALGPRAHRLHRLAEHPQHGYLALAEAGVEIESEGRLQGRKRQLVGAQRPLERVAPETLDELGAADDDPGLRAAEQLVAREADEVCAGRQRSSRRRLVPELGQDAGTEVVDDRKPARPGDTNELRELRLLGEADDAEIGLVDPQEERRLRPDRALVVRG